MTGIILEHNKLFHCKWRILSSAENLCKLFGPRSGPTLCRSWSGSKLFDTNKCADPGFFVRGGGGGDPVTSVMKKLWRFCCFLFSPQLILQKSNGYFKENYNFPRFQRGSNIFHPG